MDGDWRDKAICAYVDPDLWYPENGLHSRAARRICRTCPVRAECLDHALRHHEQHGIWGGLSYTQRLRLTRAGQVAA